MCLFCRVSESKTWRSTWSYILCALHHIPMLSQQFIISTNRSLPQHTAPVDSTFSEATEQSGLSAELR
jgi:hypothetical protein